MVRLDKLDGTVARHEKEFGEMKIHLAERDQRCPRVDAPEERLRKVEGFVTAEKASQAAPGRENKQGLVGSSLADRTLCGGRCIGRDHHPGAQPRQPAHLPQTLSSPTAVPLLTP